MLKIIIFYFNLLFMYRVFKYRKVIFMIVLMVLVTSLLSCVSIFLLYSNSKKNVRNRLTEAVERERFFVLSILKDNTHNEHHIIEHLRDTSTRVDQYSEIVFVRAMGDSIEFLMSSKHLDEKGKIHQAKINQSSFWKAVNRESGFMKDIDQWGEKVYAAYTHVGQLKWGIVAKVSVAQTNRPFIEAFIVVLVITVILVLVLAVILFKMVYPIIDDLKRKEQLLIKAKEAAEESERQLIKAQKTSKTGNWVWYMNENRVWWSDEMYRIFEVDKEGFKGDVDQIIENSVHPDDRQIVIEANMLVISGGKPVSVEYRIVKADGSLKYVYAIADEIIYDESGKRKCLIGVVKDITDYKQVQLELIKAKDQAEQSDRLKTAFLQNMSHEIRTPMNAIMGFSELMGEELDNKQVLKKYSAIINQRCSDLLEIINDILNVAQIESGQLPVNVEPCILEELFSEIAVFFTEYQKKQGKQNIGFEIDLQDIPSNFQFYTDKVKLKQILINLIGNAFKFTDIGLIKVGCKLKKDGKVEFFVSDTGIGIPSEKQDLIFERFVQLEPTPGRLFGGTGLGLSIVKGLIDLLNGKLWLESQLSKGTTFHFSIPGVEVPQQTSPEVEKGDEAKFNFAGKTLLIVEDDEYNAEYLTEILASTGINILHTLYGKEALEIVGSKNVDVVLMDIRLPDIDGYEATKMIKEFKPQTIIVAQTAYAAPSDKQQAIDAGCDYYLSKPVSRFKVLSLLKKIIEAISPGA